MGAMGAGEAAEGQRSPASGEARQPMLERRDVLAKETW